MTPRASLRRLLCALAFAPAFALAAPVASAQQNDLTRTVGVTVPESSSNSVRLLNLPKGTRLALAVRSQAPLWVLFLDEANFKRFPQGATAVLTARVATGLSFGVQVPESGNYYIMLDNRENDAPNRLEIQLRATPIAGSKTPVDPKPQLQQF